MLIYTPLEIYKDIMHGNGIVKSILIYFRGFLFVGEQYNSWHLWYLLSTIYSLILIIILYKLKIFRNMGGGMLIIGIVFSVISVGTSQFVLTEKNLIKALLLIKKLITYSIGSGRIFKGMIFIPLGIYLAKKEY